MITEQGEKSELKIWGCDAMRDFLRGYNFVFSYTGITAGFQKISGLERKLDVEYLREGGRDTAAYPLVSQPKTAGKLILERGYGELNPFYEKTGYKVGMQLDGSCIIKVLDEEKNVKRSFSFNRGVITGWECSTLDAQSSALIIDKLVIEHTGIMEC